jgi:DNA-binding transcriptional regulator YiaG
MAIPASRGRLNTDLKNAAKTALGPAVRSIRRRLSLTQVVFSEQLLIRQNTLSQIESGQFTPSAPKLLSLLRLAATDDERGPIVNALEAHGIMASDLAPVLLVSRETPPAAMGSVCPEVDQTSMSTNEVFTDKEIA